MSGIDDFLDRARGRLKRLSPQEAWWAARDRGLIVDIRPAYQRAADGEITGAIVIERNHLEWRLDPACPARIAEAVSADLRWIIICDEGYSSSLAAAALHDIGLTAATDVIGGFQQWREAGLPVARPGSPARPRLALADRRI
ncbi:hypothetical protein HS041_02555 [Planomonospora sp. ID67723]|uniref:rhodanese-like domain-containing protein n=1 Tax=Planomonospora sp. ID67723 TaxID=2738134 RepID=UPI0018C3769B|nr:rhodanese-like domain-containing protein [Planomonospora sp. ID67723]MBG0826656.1 hypothetical protein [Planomonospora sp. ID67723]